MRNQGSEVRELLKISEMARLTGVTVRTLHYYDEVGLLKPSETNSNGYREYNSECIDKLAQILFFRELDFSIKDIIKIMDSPSFDALDVLQRQKLWLIEERNRLNRLIELAEKSIKGERTMDFKAFDKHQNEQYRKEAQERWGESVAYQESQKKTSGYDVRKWMELKEQMDEMIRLFANHRSLAPQSDAAQALVQQWKEHISKSYYDCTNEVLKGLGEMYVGDERFTKNIDQHGEGTAAFMNAAIQAYCEKQA